MIDSYFWNQQINVEYWRDNKTVVSSERILISILVSWGQIGASVSALMR